MQRIRQNKLFSPKKQLVNINKKGRLPLFSCQPEGTLRLKQKHIAHDIMVEDKVEEQVLRQKEKDILFNGTWRETKSKVTYS